MQVRQGTRVLVTGASRGLGRSIAEAFAWRGATLGLVARTESELRTLVDELPGADHKILIADVSDRRQMAGAVAAFGEIEVVVANAGVARYLNFPELPLDEAERMTNVNWLGTLYTVQPALERMVARGSGSVVIVSSAAGVRAFPQASVYGATKAAQLAFGRALQHELDGTGVSVTLVLPGELETHLHDHQRDELPDWREDKYALPARPLAERVVTAVERGQLEVYYPGSIKALRLFQGVSPMIADRLLRLMRGKAAAPRR
ncbi:MAG TPA: SDR family NAD(P)-dependent oxidoreductase [Thermoleophilaceae bacterium]|nr:SDR family NAD(P)-dependent oxidoreductase [Thermoleophilaceae bacterium]